jgi:hypothetical protein
MQGCRNEIVDLRFVRGARGRKVVSAADSNNRDSPRGHLLSYWAGGRHFSGQSFVGMPPVILKSGAIQPPSIAVR